MALNTETSELRLKGLKALRSRRYHKGRGFLRWGGDGKTMCVQGVLCDVSGLGEWSCNAYVVGKSRATKFMPSAVREAYGLTPKQSEEISKMNDGYSGPEFSLKQIADHLESLWFSSQSAEGSE